MECKNAIFQRNSCRSYIKKDVEESLIHELIAAGNAAPVGMGQFDTLHISVIQSTELLKEIDRTAAEFVGKPESHPLYGAPVMILVSAQIPPAPMENMVYMDAGCIIENVMLAATEAGLGSCFIMGAVAALNTNRTILEKLHLPDGMIPIGACILGYSDVFQQSREMDENKISCSWL